MLSRRAGGCGEETRLLLKAGGKQRAVLKTCQGRGTFGELFAVLVDINTVLRTNHCSGQPAGTKAQIIWFQHLPLNVKRSWIQ